jgi:RecJ-like exonuclease
VNEDFKKLLSKKDFIEKIMTLKTKEEIKNFLSAQNVEATDEEIDMLISVILKSIENNGERELSENELEQIFGGSVQGAVRVVGQVVSFPVRAVFYTAGAIVASAPKGLIDGFYDSWTNWDDYNENKNKK